jgi:hypothetical protein
VSEADIQALLDGIAADLGAAVALVDLEERYIAHTAHDNVEIDDVRRAGIMHRRLEPEARAWFEQWGYRQATGPIQTPADETLGILERWCVPVSFRGTRLGSVWLIGGREIRQDELGPAVEAANQIAAFLYRRRLLTQIDSDLLRLLLIPNSENESVAAEARALGRYDHNGPIAVIVAGSPNGDELGSAALSDLASAVERAGEQAALGGVISGLGVLLAPLRSQEGLTPARKLAERVRRLANPLSEGLDIVAAIGGATELERASHSYAEARRALKMVRAMPDLGPITIWDDLGVFRTLALVLSDEAGSGAIDPRVAELLADEGLAVTAESFLDLAGDVQKTAAKLFVHRTTLYQRLDRIAALYRLDLRHSGDHRLITHLGLKLARVASH